MGYLEVDSTVRAPAVFRSIATVRPDVALGLIVAIRSLGPAGVVGANGAVNELRHLCSSWITTELEQSEHCDSYRKNLVATY